MVSYAGVDNCPGSFPLVDDGVEDEAIAFNIAFEALGDRTAYLYRRTNAVGLVCVAVGSFSAWTDSPLEFDGSGSPFPPSEDILPVIIATAAVGDVFEFSMTATLAYQYVLANGFTFNAALKDEQSGGSPQQIASGLQQLSGIEEAGSGSGTLALPISIACTRTITSAGTYEVGYSMAMVSPQSTDKAYLSNLSILYRQWRSI